MKGAVANVHSAPWGVHRFRGLQTSATKPPLVDLRRKLSETIYERYTFPHDLTRIFGKSRVETCNVRKFFLTKGNEIRNQSPRKHLLKDHVPLFISFSIINQMGNQAPRERSRSHSADLYTTKQLEQRHHAKSEEIPFDHYDSTKVHNPYMSPLNTSTYSSHYTSAAPNRTKPSVRNSDNGLFFRAAQCFPSATSPPQQSLKLTNSKSAKSPHKLPRSKSLKSSKSMRSLNLDESTKSMKSSKSSKTSKTPKSHGVGDSKPKSSKSSRSESPVARSKSATYFDPKSRGTNGPKLKTLIIEGWLTKLGESSKKYKKRYWKLYDSGKLVYSEKPNGRYRKYAELRDGIESMALKDETGFEMQIGAERFLAFFAESKSQRDEWFAIIYHHFYIKGQQQVHQLIAKANGHGHGGHGHIGGHIGNKQVHFAAQEEYDQFDENGLKSNKRNSAKQESFDSIKAAMNGGKENVFTIVTPTTAAPNGATTNGHGQSGYNHNGSGYGPTYGTGAPSNPPMNGQNGYHQQHPLYSNPNPQAHNVQKPKVPKEDGMIIFSEQYMKLECDGKTCLSLERVHYVLRKYGVWRTKATERTPISLGMYRYINQGLGEYYNNTHLLNDYHHLVAVHDNVFHHIYEYLDGECPLGPETRDCLLVQRLHRDRNYYRNDAERKKIYYGYDDPKEMNTQQILDKIHCHFRHSYDLGLRVKKSKLLAIAKDARAHRRHQTSRYSRSITMKNRMKLRSEESKAAEAIINAAEQLNQQNEVVSDQEDNGENVETPTRARPRSITKQSTNKTVHYQHQPAHTAQGSLSVEDELDDLHGFEDEWKLLEICGLIHQKRDRLIQLRGSQRMNSNKFISRVGTAQRFHYWDSYDDDDDRKWRVRAKHNDFKREMLDNSLYSISAKQWDCLCEKARDHFGTARSRKIRPHKYWAELYDLPTTESANASYSVQESHLIAMILYCNFDVL